MGSKPVSRAAHDGRKKLTRGFIGPAGTPAIGPPPPPPLACAAWWGSGMRCSQQCGRRQPGEELGLYGAPRGGRRTAASAAAVAAGSEPGPDLLPDAPVDEAPVDGCRATTAPCSYTKPRSSAGNCSRKLAPELHVGGLDWGIGRHENTHVMCIVSQCGVRYRSARETLCSLYCTGCSLYGSMRRRCVSATVPGARR